MDQIFILHCIKAWVLPPGLNVAIFLLGMFLCLFSSSLGRLFSLLGLILLWLFSAPIFSYNFIERLQNQFQPITLNTLHNQVPAHAAIVVLGGGNTTSVEEGNQQTVSDETFDRLRYAAALYQETHLPIIVSGGNGNGASTSSARLMSNTLKKYFNIPSTIEEDKSLNTAEESKLLKPLLAKYNINTIYLVTHAWHMPRSVYLFKREGINVIAAPMGYEVYDHRYSLLSYFPDLNALSATATAMHEYVGLFVAHWFYGS